MKHKIVFPALITFLLAAGSYGQISTGSPNRLLFSQLASSDGGDVVNITYTGLERPNVQIFESLVPASSAAECESTTAFPNPRVLRPDVATVVFDASTSTYKVRWLTPKPSQNSCRVLRVGDSIDNSDLAVWKGYYGAGGFAEFADDARLPGLSEVTYTYEVRNPGFLWTRSEKE